MLAVIRHDIALKIRKGEADAQLGKAGESGARRDLPAHLEHVEDHGRNRDTLPYAFDQRAIKLSVDTTISDCVARPVEGLGSGPTGGCRRPQDETLGRESPRHVDGDVESGARSARIQMQAPPQRRKRTSITLGMDAGLVKDLGKAMGLKGHRRAVSGQRKREQCYKGQSAR